MRRLAAGAVVVGALIPAGAGAASACDGGHHGGVAGASYTRSWEHHHMHGTHGVLAVAVSYLGLSKATIVTDLKNGQSLADIANATSGKSESGLVDAYSAALKAKLDAWVAAGKIDTAKENEILSDAVPWITKLVETHFTGWHWSFDRRH
jgi:hypothetical protein